MIRSVLLALITSVILASAAFGGQQETGRPRKQARASRLEGSIRLDGHLDDAGWRNAVPLVDFVQAEPVEGAEPTDRMEIRFVYDDTALWIGARMESADGAVQAPMSRRDDGDQAEYLQIELDTYLDRRTAYMFGVTASGVRLDHLHTRDDESEVDWQFDPVWQAKTSIDAHGWTAELWLPFSQLRFNNQPERLWGLNVKRWRPTLNEQDYWIVVGRTNRGWASRFGDLRGIAGVEPKKRAEIMPYVSSSSRTTGNRDRRNPFDKGLNLAGGAGADIKIGVGSNFTLDATFNPDFGQVEADPAEVNLTVFETLFDERRPFFIEGSNVLGEGNSYFYSRRIGAPPTGPATGEFRDYPRISTILGAAKLTGRTRSGTSLGFLGAVTDEESARISTAGLQSDVNVAARTAWSVGRVLQQFGNQGSTVGGQMTLVHRDFSPTDPLAALQTRNAVTGSGDWRFRFKDSTYEASGFFGMTYVDGEPAAISAVQRRNGHLLQRLDQPHIRFDPTRTSLFGTQTSFDFNKIAGRHWLWGYHNQIESPGFEPQDLGRLNYAGDIQGGPRITYRETRPGRIFRQYSFAVSMQNYWFFDTDLGVRNSLTSSNSFTWKNFWATSFNFTQFFRGPDVQATRGGPTIGTPLGWSQTTTLKSRAGSKNAWSGTGTIKGNEFDERSWELTGSISARPSPSIQFSFAPDYVNETGVAGIFQGPIGRQYLATLDGGSPATYGKRYVFGLANRTTVSAQFRFNYTLRPDVTLDVYAEPFAASGRYDGFGELAVSRGRDLRIYGTDGTTITRLPDGSYRVTDGAAAFVLNNKDLEFNSRSFRSNVVLRWEWRPGSTLFVVWQQNRASSVAEGQHVGLGDLFGSLSAQGDNVVAVKSTLWISR